MTRDFIAYSIREGDLEKCPLCGGPLERRKGRAVCWSCRIVFQSFVREGLRTLYDAIGTCIFALAVIGWAVALGGV